MSNDLKIVLSHYPAELKQGLEAVTLERAECFGSGAGMLKLSFEADNSLAGGRGLAVTYKGEDVQVRYGHRTDAFRALGGVLGQDKPRDFSETPKFDTLGIMLDVSRNAVMTVDTAKALICRCALMGINTLMLYMEDTYEVPGEPFFGYLRGRYTYDELKELDDYAYALGMEIIPCIQTLGHLEQILQWPAYADYMDTNGVILAGEARTYALLEKMITAATVPFRSKRIHIGMDEAHGIGSGKYKELHGERRPFDILNEHLVRVKGICDKLGLQPMIWSDMYFRLGSRTNNYYDKESVIPADVASAIPAGVDLVYWDYYHTDKDFYMDWIDRHRAMGKEPVMAGGVWTWDRFWTALPFSFIVTEACMTAAREKGLKEAHVTMWGDDGNECDIFSALPGIQFFAEHGWANTVDKEKLRANFRGTCGVSFDDWLKAADVDPGKLNSNASKWLLWEDPIIGMLEPETEGRDLQGYYGELADLLFAAADKSPLASRLQFPAHLARVLALKSGLRREISAAYKVGDRAKLGSIIDGRLIELQTAAEALWLCHRDMWLKTYKPFGLEVIEQRYGGLLIRLRSLSDRLAAYLNGDIASIPELETDLCRIFDAGEELPHMRYNRAKTPSALK
ncbi:MAG: beta-N-acetylhexosaminidase [bacterium]|nr:beta-N-acetylhexosaminidase [bacterium]